MNFVRNAGNKLRQMGQEITSKPSIFQVIRCISHSKQFRFDAEESKSTEGTADDYAQDEPVKGNYRDDDDDVPGSLSRHRFRSPPAEIMAIVDAPRRLVALMSPTQDKIVWLKKSTLPPLHELGRLKEERLAGLQIDSECNSLSRIPYYCSIEGIQEGKKPMKKISGIPCGAKIHYINWSYDGQHLSFTVQTDKKNGDRSMLSIWIADVISLNARPLLPPEMFINAIFTPFLWVSKSTLLVPTIPMSRRGRPEKPRIPFGPTIFSNEENKIIQARTYPGLLTDEHDVAGFEYYTTSQLVLVSVDGSRKFFGSKAIYTSFDLSYDEKFILISSIHPPYSPAVNYYLFPKKVEVWTTAGKFVTQVCNLPLAEDIPCAHHCVRKGMRHIQWVPCIFPTLLWVTTQDGGDAKVKANPRDIIYTQRVDSFGREEPKVFYELPFRFRYIKWRFQEDLYAYIWVEGQKKSIKQVYYEHDDAFKNDVYSAISSLKLGKTYGIVDTESARIDGFPYAKKTDIQYKREDGKELNANLYLPPSYNRDQDGPLPCLVYPYPRSRIAVPETIFISPTSPQIWLSRGFVVLTNLSMPVIDDKHKGEGYDRFVEQLVTSVEAAVKEVIRLGVADPSKIAIGGHSFGALMTSVLLVHACTTFVLLRNRSVWSV